MFTNQRFRCLIALAASILVSSELTAQGYASRIFRVDPDGSNLYLVADENTMKGRNVLGAPDVSHDGKWIVFDATPGRNFKATHLIQIGLKGDDRGKVVDLGAGVCSEFSPDGERIAFFLNGNNTAGVKSGVWIMNRKGEDRVRLSVGYTPHWSQDGEALFAPVKFMSPHELWRVHVENQSRIRILENQVILGQPATAPDGHRIAVTVKEGDERQLRVYAPEPHDETDMLLWRDNQGTLTYDETWPDWSPDGKTIVFTNGSDMMLVPADGSAEAKRVELPVRADGRDCTWSADGKHLYFASMSNELRDAAAPLFDTLK